MKILKSGPTKRLLEIVTSILPIGLYCLDIACALPGDRNKENTAVNAMSRLSSGTYVANCHQDAALTAALSSRLTFWKSSVTLRSSAYEAIIVHEGFATADCATSEVQLRLSADYLLEDREQDDLLDLRLNSGETLLTALTPEAAVDLNTAKICGFTYDLGESMEIDDATCDQSFVFASGHNFWTVLQTAADDRGFVLGASFSLNANEIPTALNSYSYNVK